MLINIHDVNKNKKFNLNVSSEISLRELYEQICITHNITHKSKMLFEFNDNALNWGLTIHELVIFYNFTSEKQILLKDLKKTERNKSAFINKKQDILFSLLEQALNEKNKEWHSGQINSKCRVATIPKENVLFADRYQILSALREKNIINIYKALDLNESRVVYIFVGYKNIIDYHLPNDNIFQSAVLKTYDIGEYENYIFSIVEYEKGHFLYKIIEKNNLDIISILTIFIKISDILLTLHNNGLFYKSLGSDDIILDEMLNPCLVQNGLFYKKAPGNWPKKKICPLLTIENKALYQSPEVVYGKKESIKANIFSLGAILYHMITGKPPFGYHKESITHDDLTSAKTLKQEIPQSLSLLLSDMLSENTKIRPNSMTAVKEALYNIKKEIEHKNIQKVFGNKFKIEILDVGKERNDSIRSFLSVCIDKSHLITEKDILFIQAIATKEQAKIIEYFGDIHEDIRELWLEKTIYWASLPIKVINLVSFETLLKLIHIRDEKIQRQISKSILLRPLHLTFFTLLTLLHKKGSHDKSYILTLLQTNRDKIIGPIFLMLFDNKRKKLKSIQNLCKELKLESLAMAVIELKKGNDHLWHKTMKTFEKHSFLYFSILSALTTLLKDENRDIRWLAGHALFLLTPNKILQKYLLSLKNKEKFTDLLRIVNFAGAEIGKNVIVYLRGHKEDTFLKKIWDLRWNTSNEERIVACQALGQNKTEESLVFLIETLFSTCKELQKEAENAIIKIGIPSVKELIKFITENQLKEAISNILKTLGSPVVRELVIFLEETNSLIEKKCIIRAIGLVGGEEAICALLPYLSEEKKVMYFESKQELIAQKEKSEEWLLPALKGTPYVRQRVQEILVTIGSEKGIESLFQDLAICDPTLEQHICNLLVQIDMRKLSLHIKNTKSCLLVKMCCMLKKQSIKEVVIDELLNRNVIINEFLYFVSSSNENFQFIANNIYLDSLLSKIFDFSSLFSIKAAYLLSIHFKKDSALLMVSAWYKLWEKEISYFILSGKMDLQDLEIIEDPFRIESYKESIIRIGIYSVLPLVKRLESASTIIGLKIVEILASIETESALNELRKILKNKTFPRLLRQFSHICLCIIEQDMHLIIQFLQQEKNSYIGKQAKRILVQVIYNNSAFSDVLVRNIIKLKGEDIIPDLLMYILLQESNMDAYFLFIKELGAKNAIPHLLKNLRNSNPKLVKNSIESLSIFPNKQVLNALQMLLLRETNNEQIKFLETHINKIRSRKIQ